METEKETEVVYMIKKAGEQFIARRFVDGNPTEEGFVNDSIAGLRTELEEAGCVVVDRNPEGDVIETWLEWNDEETN